MLGNPLNFLAGRISSSRVIVARRIGVAEVASKVVPFTWIETLHHTHAGRSTRATLGLFIGLRTSRRNRAALRITLTPKFRRRLGPMCHGLRGGFRVLAFG